MKRTTNSNGSLTMNKTLRIVSCLELRTAANKQIERIKKKKRKKEIFAGNLHQAFALSTLGRST